MRHFTSLFLFPLLVLAACTHPQGWQDPDLKTGAPADFSSQAEAAPVALIEPEAGHPVNAPISTEGLPPLGQTVLIGQQRAVVRMHDPLDGSFYAELTGDTGSPYTPAGLTVTSASGRLLGMTGKNTAVATASETSGLIKILPNAISRN